MTDRAEAIMRHIDDDETIELTFDMCRIPSFSGEEVACARWLAGRMEQLGFDEVYLQEVEPGRPNVIGVLKGDGTGPSFMFNGHLDIDPFPADQTEPDWRPSIKDGMLYGLGVGNMKGGNAAMVMAATALKRSGLPLTGDVIVAGVVGELQGGIGTRHMIDQGLVPDIAIVPEPTNNNVRTIHAGVLEFLLHVTVPASTGGRDRPANAIRQMHDVMEALKSVRYTYTPREDLPALPAMVVGAAMGGRTSDYLPSPIGEDAGHCTLAVDVRLAPDMTVDSVCADLERALAPVRDAGVDCRIDLPPAAYAAPFRAMGLFMPPNDLPTDDPLAQSTFRWHREITGEDPQLGVYIPGSYAGADSGHLAQAGTRCLNYGPTHHTRWHNECRLSNLSTATRVLAQVAGEFCTRAGTRRNGGTQA